MLSKLFVFISIVTGSQITAFGQIFHKNELFKGVNQLKIQYFQEGKRSGGWYIKTFDEKGRMTLRETYSQQNKLTDRTTFEYNQNDDEIKSIYIHFNIQPVKNDTNFDTHSYEYNDKSEIIFENLCFGRVNISTKLVSSKNVSLREYIEIKKQPQKDQVFSDTTYISVVLNQNRLIKKETHFQPKHNYKKTIEYDYYKDGWLKRIKTTKMPGIFGIEVQEDTENFEYSYDKLGRIVELFRIVDNKKVKMQEWEYLN